MAFLSYAIAKVKANPLCWAHGAIMTGSGSIFPTICSECFRYSISLNSYQKYPLCKTYTSQAQWSMLMDSALWRQRQESQQFKVGLHETISPKQKQISSISREKCHLTNRQPVFVSPVSLMSSTKMISSRKWDGVRFITLDTVRSKVLNSSLWKHMMMLAVGRLNG